MMRSDWLADWSDNPIFIKHLRSRLRRQPLVSAIVVTVVLCICIAWSGFVLKSFTTGGAFGALFALQAVILAIMGSTQVGTSVSSARTSGILDFHRVSPLSATELVLGFFFGAPVREYLLVACTLPFVLLCLAFGTPDFRGLVQLMIVLIATSWVLQGFSLLNALVMKRQTGSRGVVGLLIFLGLFSGTFITGFGRVANLVEQEPRLSLFGISLPWLAVVLLYEAATLFFIFLASCRKMESERLHPFSKPQAVAAMTTLAVLIVGAVWDLSDLEAMAVTVLYLLVIIGILLTITVTPTQAEYYKGLWRAVKQGRPRPSFWDDLSPNRPFLAVVCALVLIAGTIAWRRLGGAMAGNSSAMRSAFPLAIANGVLVVAYFGLAHQFFQLRFGRRGSNAMALFLFMIWGVPLVLGTIMLFANFSDSGPAQTVYALSPVAGLALSTGTAESAGTNLMAVEAAAITPSLLFTFVFNNLVTVARRRVQRAVLSGIEKTNATEMVAS